MPLSFGDVTEGGIQVIFDADTSALDAAIKDGVLDLEKLRAATAKTNASMVQFSARMASDMKVVSQRASAAEVAVRGWGASVAPATAGLGAMSAKTEDMSKKIRGATATLRSLRWAWRDVAFAIGIAATAVYAINKAIKNYAQRVEESPELFTAEDTERVKEYREETEKLSRVWDKVAAQEMERVTSFARGINQWVEAGMPLVWTPEQQASVGWMRKGLDAATQSYTAMAKAAEMTKEQIKAMTRANEDFLSGISSLESETDKYNERMETLQAKLADVREEQAKYWEGSRKWTELEEKAADYEKQIASLQEKHEEFTKRMIWDLTRAKMAIGGLNDEEMQDLLDLGVQMGIFDEKTVTAYRNITSAAEDWTRTLTEANSKIQSIIRNTEQLDGMEAFVDIYITQHGTIPHVGGVYVDLSEEGKHCFVAGTPVDTPSGQRPIETLAAGDEVLLKQDNGAVVVARVAKPVTGKRSDLVAVTTDAGEFVCSPNHLWKTAGGFVMAQDLRHCDVIVGRDKNHEVRNVEPVEGEHAVYNIEVDHPEHTYMVGGHVVHNAKPYATGGPVYAGREYLVGEHGPEKFVPGSNGQIIPNLGSDPEVLAQLSALPGEIAAALDTALAKRLG